MGAKKSGEILENSTSDDLSDGRVLDALYEIFVERRGADPPGRGPGRVGVPRDPALPGRKLRRRALLVGRSRPAQLDLDVAERAPLARGLGDGRGALDLDGHG